MAEKKLRDPISLTQAAGMLKKRYLKARDLALQGLLGEVEQRENGRIFVSKSGVEKYARENARNSK